MKEQQWDVIVIGAGIAGLKAAADIRQAGLSVVVLESRDRIGGRVHTRYDIAPIPVELGAELIHTDAADTWELVHLHNIQTHQQGKIGKIQNGKWREYADEADDKAITKLMRQAERIGLPHEKENMADYLTRLGMSSAEYPGNLRAIEYDTVGFDRWSAHALIELMSKHLDSEADGSDYHVIGGQHVLVDTLARDQVIHLEQIVTRIVWNSSGVLVETESGQPYRARCVVLTIPPLVLQKHNIQFVPDLSPAKWNAIEAFQRCDIVKIIMVFDAPLFPPTYTTLVTPQGLPPIWWRSGAAYPQFQGEVLVGWAADENARRLIAMDEESALQLALQNLRDALNQHDLNPLISLRQHWNDDPFAQGAYPYLPPGSESAPKMLATPIENVLFWAGAATSSDFTSVHGGYESGRRVALEVLKMKQ